MSVRMPRWVDLKTITDRRGSLTAVESQDESLDFDLKRVYFLYGVGSSETRGAHAHRELEQLFIAVSGSFAMTLDDGVHQTSFTLDAPSRGLRVPRLYWRDLHSFSPGAVCLVLASDAYDESDYIRNYEQFKQIVLTSP